MEKIVGFIFPFGKCVYISWELRSKTSNNFFIRDLRTVTIFFFTSAKRVYAQISSRTVVGIFHLTHKGWPNVLNQMGMHMDESLNFGKFYFHSYFVFIAQTRSCHNLNFRLNLASKTLCKWWTVWNSCYVICSTPLPMYMCVN